MAVVFGRTYDDFRGGPAPNPLAVALSGMVPLAGFEQATPFTGIPSGVHAGPALRPVDQGPAGPQGVVSQQVARIPGGSHGGGGGGMGGLGAGLRSAGASIAHGIEAGMAQRESARRQADEEKARRESALKPIPWPTVEQPQDHTQSGPGRGPAPSSSWPGHGAAPSSFSVGSPDPQVMRAISESGGTPHTLKLMTAIYAGESAHVPGRYDRNINAKESSHGPFQMNIKGGLGNEAGKSGIDVTDPKTIPAQARWLASRLDRDPGLVSQFFGYRDRGASMVRRGWGSRPDGGKRAMLGASRYDVASLEGPEDLKFGLGGLV